MKTNFIQVLNDKVEIPMIQRDFAQGRLDKKTSKIRRDFLDAIFQKITEKIFDPSISNLELDFIYGNLIKGEPNLFSPIDGQQRITVLWLLYWYITSIENVAPTEVQFLNNFKYETRHSTNVFCQKLVNYSPKNINIMVSDDIKTQPWYFDDWNFDPSIKSMLVVLDDIANRYKELGRNDVWSFIKNDNCPFEMYQLNLNDFKLSDDLYIKMNSRGKPLTEFEYFKTVFSDLISSVELKSKFDKSIDQEWYDCIWKLILNTEEAATSSDIAILTDNSFLNLFNFITHILGLKNNVSYTDTVDSVNELNQIYSDEVNIRDLFNTLDSLVEATQDDSNFWESTFYVNKIDYSKEKTRLFFNHGEVNLLLRCLFSYDKGRGLSLPEQVLLHSYLFNNMAQVDNLSRKIRVIRNLVTNSDNELRTETMALSFQEVEEFLLTYNFDVLRNFKTDQIREEKGKDNFLAAAKEAEDSIYRLEDYEYFRGSISIFDLDTKLVDRAKGFLVFFDEDEFFQDFSNRSNFLLSFGDYSQSEGKWFNLMSQSKSVLRRFLVTPGYGKDKEVYSKTSPVLMSSLDYLTENSAIELPEFITNEIVEYRDKPLDWIYYFIRYPSFREESLQGYYYRQSDYQIFKMRQKQFNGFNWDPFLYEARDQVNSKHLILDNRDSPLILKKNKNKVQIKSDADGFLFENKNSNDRENSILTYLIRNQLINENNKLVVTQNEDGLDLEDRINKLVHTINQVVKNK